MVKGGQKCRKIRKQVLYMEARENVRKSFSSETGHPHPNTLQCLHKKLAQLHDKKQRFL